MELYQQKSRWKIYLAVAGIVIVLISMVYTNYLTSLLAERERDNIGLWEVAQDNLNELDEEEIDYCDYTLHSMVVLANRTIPVILVNDRGEIVDAANNFGIGEDSLSFENREILKKKCEKMLDEGFEPIRGFGNMIFYSESRILTQLRYFPLVQFLLIGAFVLFGYLGFNSARRAEQNRVWVGMAKETAHQLGTPISAIIAWIEHLKLIGENQPEVIDVAEELRNDVTRLELIADRFSKIGSSPKMDPVNAYEELDKTKRYMAKRAPRKVKFDFPPFNEEPMLININPPLFEWVIENLLRNALDSMDGTGTISAAVSEDASFVNIDISDTGKGIPPGKFKTVFQPGFTTKKRGWGLGLSLAKRIIEEYHSGRIFVQKSVEGEGTTFRIRLPRVKN